MTEASKRRWDIDMLNMRFISIHRKGLVRSLYLCYLRLFQQSILYIVNELEDCETVLDLGCGNYTLISSMQFTYSVGVDLSLTSLSKAKKRRTHQELLLADIRQLEFKSNSFDAVLALDVIEHLSKNEGYQLIRRMEQIAKKKIILITPNGYVPQMDINNPLQIHKSGWSLDDFKQMGYICEGIGGIKILGTMTRITTESTFLLQVIKDISQKIVHHLPQCAFQLLCVKVKN